MKLKSLKIKNIRSYESGELEFPSDSVLLSGDIGSGKTSVLMAIEYALFGLQPGQKGSALLRNNAHSGEVVLTFEVDGKEVVVERKLKREGKSISNDYAAITIDGIKSEISVTELKNKILALLRYPPEFLKKNNILYRYTVYTPQEQMKQIILEDAETRLNILGHVFGIDKYKRIRENLSIILTRIKEDSKLLQGEIKTLDLDKTQLESTKAFFLSLHDKVNDKELEIKKAIERKKIIETELSELEQKTKEREVFEKEVEKTMILMASKKENLGLITREIETALKTRSESTEVFSDSKLEEVSEKLLNTKGIIEKLNQKFMELIGKINSLEDSQKSHLEKKERVFSIDMCPTCLQNVPHMHKHNILLETEREIVSLKNALAVLAEEKTFLKAQLEKHKNEIPSYEKEKMRLEIMRSKVEYIEKAKKRTEEITKSKSILEKDISFLSSHLDSLKQNIFNFSKFVGQLRLKQTDLEKARSDEKRAEIAYAELKKEIEMTQKEIHNLQNIIDVKESSKKKLSDLLELGDWFSNHFLMLIGYIERNVMIKLRVEFEKLFAKWFNMLAGEPFEVHLDENFTPLIVQGEVEMEYSFLSGGERTAIALAYRLALNQTINSVLSNIKTKDLIILDEPTDGFSEVQLSKMREVIKELKIGQLIIVSHEQKIEDFVDNVVKLSKQGHSSSIEHPVL